MNYPIWSPHTEWTLEQVQGGGYLLIDKPYQWTSFDVVNKVGWMLKKRFDIKKMKVGHGGTLDPLATGLLILAIGKATTSLSTLQNSSKVYQCTIELGIQTDSYDLETEIHTQSPIDHITQELIEKTLLQFQGEIQQVPPVYSAIKKDGKTMYHQARKGIAVVMDPRTITIYANQIESYSPPHLQLLVHCSKGTYIRSLAHDLGQALGCGACLTGLRRLASDPYKIEESWQISELEHILFGGPLKKKFLENS